MANTDQISIRDAVKDIPKKYLNELSTDDLQAIVDNNINNLSDSGLEIIARGKQDLGLGELLDIGGALAGAGAGAAIGTAIFPGVGTAIGGVLGGAIGTFAGEVTEDVIADREINLGFKEGGAAKEAAISAVFDSATLGLGKAFRAYNAYRSANKTLSELGSEFNDVLNVAEAAADSPEALAQTQQVLQKNNLSLSPLATESASMLTQVGREFGEMGLLSKPLYDKDIAKSQDVILDLYSNFSNANLAKNPQEIGKIVVGLKSSADKAVHSVYGSQLKRLQELPSSRKFVSAKPVVDALESFKSKYEKVGTMPFEGKVTISSLDDAADSFVESLITDLSGSVNNRYAKFSIEGLLAVDKKINNEISKMLPGGAYGNGVARGQLRELHNAVRDSVINVMRKTDPSATKIYQKMQSEYSKAMDLLELNTVENLIKNGVNKDAYQAIGRGLISQNDPEKISELMNVARKSLILKKKANPKLNVQSAFNEFQETVRASFLKEAQYTRLSPVGKNKAISNIFSEAGGATQMLEQSDRMKAIMGNRWPEFKKLLNHVVAMSKKRNQEVFSLAQRSAEIQAGTTLLGAGSAIGAFAAGSSAIGLASLAAAGAILTAPLFLYKMTSRPALVNKYIALDNMLLKKAEKGDSKKVTEFAISNVSKLLAELNDEDALDIRQSVSDPNYQFGQ